MRNCQAKSKTNGLRKKSRVRDGGFTLMEILIALSIFSVGILAVAAMQIRSMQANNLAEGTQDGTAPDGTLVTWTVTDVDIDGVAGTAELKRITVQTTYNDGLGNTKTLRVSGAYPILAAPP